MKEKLDLFIKRKTSLDIGQTHVKKVKSIKDIVWEGNELLHRAQTKGNISAEDFRCVNNDSIDKHLNQSELFQMHV